MKILVTDYPWGQFIDNKNKWIGGTLLKINDEKEVMITEIKEITLKTQTHHERIPFFKVIGGEFWFQIGTDGHPLNGIVYVVEDGDKINLYDDYDNKIYQIISKIDLGKTDWNRNMSLKEALTNGFKRMEGE